MKERWYEKLDKVGLVVACVVMGIGAVAWAETDQEKATRLAGETDYLAGQVDSLLTATNQACEEAAAMAEDAAYWRAIAVAKGMSGIPLSIADANVTSGDLHMDTGHEYYISAEQKHNQGDEFKGWGEAHLAHTPTPEYSAAISDFEVAKNRFDGIGSQDAMGYYTLSKQECRHSTGYGAYTHYYDAYNSYHYYAMSH